MRTLFVHFACDDERSRLWGEACRSGRGVLAGHRFVVDAPGELVDDAEWVVELHALGRTWHSRSTVGQHDPAARRFAYRSCTDDGNPSWVDWQWSVDTDPAGAEVTVRWELHPVTFWRRMLFSHIRRRQLARTEVPASLAALSTHVLAVQRAR